jgi:hypothetical protein
MANENNEYLPQIANWEGVKTFILPNEFVNRKFDKIQEYIEKEFNDKYTFISNIKQPNEKCPL